MLNFQNADIFRAALENSSAGVCMVDHDRKIVFWKRRIGKDHVGGTMLQTGESVDALMARAGTALRQSAVHRGNGAVVLPSGKMPW